MAAFLKMDPKAIRKESSIFIERIRNPLTNRNRGKKSGDDKIFSSRWLPFLQDATDDCCFLLSRGYTENSVVQLVGNRYKLNKRQRIAIRRICASDDQIRRRNATELGTSSLVNRDVAIDGFNLLILMESALSGGYLFRGRDGAWRDLSSVHGSYKRVSRTGEAIQVIGQALRNLKVQHVRWYFDRPVSNSGRLKTMLTEFATDNHFTWEVSLVNNPDPILAKSQLIVITSDSWILDRVSGWYNLADYVLHHFVPDATLIEV